MKSQALEYYIVDAFTDKPFGGNPAGVVLLEGDTTPPEELMLHLAAELRYPETAFIRRHSPQEFTIRYFTPTAEVELCGHATIAAFCLLRHKGLASDRPICHTLAGDLSIEAGQHVMMQMAKPRIVKTIDDTEAVYRALGANCRQPAMPVQVVYAGLPDLMIPLPDVPTLNSLKPDMQAVAALTQRQGPSASMSLPSATTPTPPTCATLHPSTTSPKSPRQAPPTPPSPTTCGNADASAPRRNAPSYKARPWGAPPSSPQQSTPTARYMSEAQPPSSPKAPCSRHFAEPPQQPRRDNPAPIAHHSSPWPLLVQPASTALSPPFSSLHERWHCSQRHIRYHRAEKKRI